MRLRPYISNKSPVDGAISISTSTVITFKFRSDVTTVNSVTANVTVNGHPAIVLGVQQTGYTATATPNAGTVDISITPSVALPVGVTIIKGDIVDGNGLKGYDWFEFDSEPVEVITLVERPEPSSCVYSNLPSPLFAITDGVCVADSNTITSASTQWFIRDARPGDYIRILSGANVGDYIIRTSSVPNITVYGRMLASETNVAIQVFRSHSWSESNQLNLCVGADIRYPLMKVRGTTAERYFGGFDSNTYFPVGFRTAPAHSSITNTGSGSWNDQDHKRLDFQLKANPVPSPGAFDKYSLLLHVGGPDISVAPIPIGTRTWCQLFVSQFDVGTDIFMGLVDNQLCPSVSATDRCGAGVKYDGVSVRLFSYNGIQQISVDTGLVATEFINKNWLIETELITSSVVKVSLYSFETVTLVATVSVSNITPSSVDRFSVTTLGDASASTSALVSGYIKYVDVEPGTGAVFSSAGGINSSTNKFRPYINMVPVDASYGGDGAKIFTAIASMDGQTPTASATANIVADTEIPIVIIDSMVLESPIVEAGIGKVSDNSGFNTITLTFRGSRIGFYYVIMNGTTPNNGKVLQTGQYRSVNSIITTSFVVEDFNNFSDGSCDIAVLLCKNGPTGASSEDEVIVDVSSQVDGAASTFSAGQAYTVGTLKVWLDGVFQNYILPGRIVETDPATGSFTLSTIPRMFQILVIVFSPV